ncbi:hypothetical protein yaldo0001_2850 [Yersinia aldovae ATCC 35236]|nr:hypothetical protein yaldo0001_2850 [Yersinia aldovae ATCC 35236]
MVLYPNELELQVGGKQMANRSKTGLNSIYASPQGEPL